jgi:hypothetical protein
MSWTLQATGGRALSCKTVTPFTSIPDVSAVTLCIDGDIRVLGPQHQQSADVKENSLTSTCGEDRCSECMLTASPVG